MGLIRYLFFEKKHLAYTAFGLDMYYGACGKFSQHGVSYDVARKMTANLFDTSRQSFVPGSQGTEFNNAQYDFYVKKEDQYRAQQALSQPN